jgi:hypothetical protein
MQYEHNALGTPPAPEDADGICASFPNDALGIVKHD